jgi:HEAT repeat protein
MQRKEGLPFLINVLRNDANPEARETAVVLIDRINDPSAVPALEEALKDRNKQVRLNAKQALKKMTGKDYEWK